MQYDRRCCRIQQERRRGGKSDFISGFCDAWRAHEVWLRFQFEFALGKVIMQRTAGCIMRWGGDKNGKKMQMLQVYRVKQQQIKGTPLHRILLAGVFTRVGINVKVEGVDGSCVLLTLHHFTACFFWGGGNSSRFHPPQRRNRGGCK